MQRLVKMGVCCKKNLVMSGCSIRWLHLQSTRSAVPSGFIFLEPMLLEPGLGTLLFKRDHLALDGPNVQLTSPT